MARAFLVLAPVVAALCAVAVARPPAYALPEEAPVTLPPGPGAELTMATCSACHSLDYVTTQPRGKGAQFWKDSVAKMVSVYGAPVGKEDAETISAYLATTYGGPAR
jgi:mono/diheme cytochrome c family protein